MLIPIHHQQEMEGHMIKVLIFGC